MREARAEDVLAHGAGALGIRARPPQAALQPPGDEVAKRFVCVFERRRVNAPPDPLLTNLQLGVLPAGVGLRADRLQDAVSPAALSILVRAVPLSGLLEWFSHDASTLRATR